MLFPPNIYFKACYYGGRDSHFIFYLHFMENGSLGGQNNGNPTNQENIMNTVFRACKNCLISAMPHNSMPFHALP